MNEVDHVHSFIVLYYGRQYGKMDRIRSSIPSNKIILGVFTRRGSYYE